MIYLFYFELFLSFSLFCTMYQSVILLFTRFSFPNKEVLFLISEVKHPTLLRY